MRRDGTLQTRVEGARALGNHVVTNGLAAHSDSKLRAMAAAQGATLAGYAPPPQWQFGMPTTGTVRVLALLISFPDYPPEHTVAEYSTLLFADGDMANQPYASLRTFYRASSYDKLKLEGNVLGYFSTTTARSAISTTTVSEKTLIKQALEHYDAQGHDFSQYDNNGDGYVDYFLVFWTGPTGDWATFWWPHMSTFSDSTVVVDGKRFRAYSWNRALPSSLPLNARTEIHETGHALGLPDLYDYDDSVGPPGGVGAHDIMGSGGSYSDHNAFSKFMLDWLEPRLISSNSTNVTLTGAGASAQALQVIGDLASPDPFKEFFMVENRYGSREGVGSGLMVWHVDARLSMGAFRYDNSYSAHKLVRLMEADGLEEIENRVDSGDSGDYYKSGKSFGPGTAPNSRLYDGADTRVTIDNISAAGLAMTFSVSVGSPAAPTGLGRSNADTDHIAWSWAPAGGATSYRVYYPTAPLTFLSSQTATTYGLGNLSTNTLYGITVSGVNLSGEGARASTQAYTAAAEAASLTYSAVEASSAVLSWPLGTNPLGTVSKLDRSTDGVNFVNVLRAAAQNLVDDRLFGCTSYYYRVSYLNGDGLGTFYTVPFFPSFLTKNSTPLPAGMLRAEPLAGNKVRLTWEASPAANMEGLLAYKVYYDAGTGVVNYSAPLAAVGAGAGTAYTTAVLPSSAAYRFALRTTNRCGVEEKNTNLRADAPSVNSLTAIRARITEPDAGIRLLKSSRLMIMAELAGGVPQDAGAVRFQYRASGAAGWTDVPSADALHLEPDPAPPYLLPWDVTGLAAGDYELRAVAADRSGTPDNAPASITFTLLNPADPDFDIDEGLSSGSMRKRQRVNNAASASVDSVGARVDGRDQVARVVLPSGSLSVSTAILTLVHNPGGASPTGMAASAIGAAISIDLSNGQHALSGGNSAVVMMSYPDSDGDGVVDGAAVRADELKLYSADALSGPWTKDETSTVDLASKTVTGRTSHFSFFALFGALAPNLDQVRVYPNPFKPNGGDPNQGSPFAAGNVNSGIIFDRLPYPCTISVYTLTGQRAAHFESASPTGSVQWDARNDAGRDMASGVYFALIESPGAGRVIKKVVIIR